MNSLTGTLQSLGKSRISQSSNRIAAAGSKVHSQFVQKDIAKKSNRCEEDASIKRPGESNLAALIFQGWLKQGRFKFVNTITLKIGGYQVAGQRYRPIFKPAAFNSTGSEQLQNWQQHVQSPGLIDRNLAYPLKSSSSLLPKMFQLPGKRAKRA